MFVCMYVCMYVYVYVYMCIYIYIHVCVCVYVRTYVCMCEFLFSIFTCKVSEMLLKSCVKGLLVCPIYFLLQSWHVSW